MTCKAIILLLLCSAVAKACIGFKRFMPISTSILANRYRKTINKMDIVFLSLRNLLVYMLLQNTG